jgi:hypothetical protein
MPKSPADHQKFSVATWPQRRLGVHGVMDHARAAFQRAMAGIAHIDVVGAWNSSPGSEHFGNY